MPFAYVVGDNDEVAPDDLACNNWDSDDDNLVAMSILDGETFLQNNKRMKCNDCAAFKSLKSQAAVGRSAIATQKAKAYSMVTSTIVTGKEKFSFDRYVGKHQQAHNDLLFMEEPVAHTKKVTDFLAGICDPKLETNIQTCMGNEQKLTNFELCQHYFKMIVENTKTRTKLPSNI
ncbi:hypothetical protein MHU86_13540 [Fragilaria crotonensis]|nr:hypothetical protein MHU86_13540 [Fragilaria crotonensis]